MARNIFPNPEKVSILSTSTFLLDGRNIVVKKLQLHGCLIIKIDPSVNDEVTVEVDGLTVENTPWSIKTLTAEDEHVDEKYKIRGFTFERTDDAVVYNFTKPGHYILN